MKSTRLHELLIARQSLAELTRKRVKAVRRGLITQEDIDHALRHGLYSARVLWAAQPIPRLPR